MTINNYYGESEGWRTYLEVYSKPEDSDKRQIHRQLMDQEAYDTWHLSFYMKEILSYKKLLQKTTIQIDELPRKEKNLLLYLIMLAMNKDLNILELGHSLFELLEGMELVKRFFNDAQYPQYCLDLKRHHYIGVDISEDLCMTSKLLHPDYDIRTINSVDQVTEPFDLLYDRNVTSYAFTKTTELANFINKSEVALMNLFVSKEATFYSLRLGKTLTYFSMEELLAHLKKPLFHLFGEKAPGPFQGDELSRGKPVVEGFFLYCNEEFGQKFMKLAEQIKEVKDYFDQKAIRLKSAASLLSK